MQKKEIISIAFEFGITRLITIIIHNSFIFCRFMFNLKHF